MAILDRIFGSRPAQKSNPTTRQTRQDQPGLRLVPAQSQREQAVEALDLQIARLEQWRRLHRSLLPPDATPDAIEMAILILKSARFEVLRARREERPLALLGPGGDFVRPVSADPDRPRKHVDFLA